MVVLTVDGGMFGCEKLQPQNMFKKIFPAASSKLLTASSQSGDSEVLTGNDLPKAAEKRHFFKSPLKWELPTKDSSTATLDPFDKRLTMTKSRSFSFHFRANNDSTFRLPKSKSVHFADDLDIRPHKPEKRGIFARSPSEPNLITSPSEASEDSLSSEKAETLTRRDVPSTSTPTASDDEIEGDSRERVAAKLEDLFSNEESLDDEPAKESQILPSILYEIYEKVCSLVDLEVQEEYAQDDAQLRTLILTGLEDSKTRLDLERKRYAKAKTENKRLKFQVQSLSSSLDSFKSFDAKSSGSASASLKAAEDEIQRLTSLVKEKDRELERFALSVKTIEEESHQLTLLLEQHKLESSTTMESLRSQVEQLKSEHAEAERVHTCFVREFGDMWSQEKQALMSQIQAQSQRAKELERFQTQEYEACRQEIMELQAKCKLLQSSRLKSEALIEDLNAKLAEKELCVTTLEVKLQEITNNSPELESLKNEKLQWKQQSETLKAELEASFAKLESDNKALRLQLETSKSKLGALTAQVQSSNTLVSKMKRDFSTSVHNEAEKAKELQDLKTSNLFAVETFKKLVKGTFEALAPVFQPESTELFTQTYYDFSRVKIITVDSQAIATILCNFLLMAVRELLSLHQKNERMLENEIQDRLKYQSQVLHAFQKIAGQILGSTRVNRGVKVSTRKKKTPKSVTSE